MYSELQVTGAMSASGVIYSANAPCLTDFDAYTKTQVNTSFAPKASPTFTGTATTPALKTFSIQTSSGVDSGVSVTDELLLVNNASQTMVTFLGATKGTIFEGNVACNTMSALKYDKIVIGAPGESGNLTVNGNATVTGNATFGGNLSLGGSLTSYSPYWIAGRIDGTTTVPTVVTSKGDKGAEITCVRKSGQPVGVYDISWTTAHPDGVNWIGMVSGEGNCYNETLGYSGTNYTNTSTGFTCLFRKLYSQPASANEAVVDCPFTFFVMK